MNPPIVYEVTRPNAHRTIRSTAKVHSMIASLSDQAMSKQRAVDAMDVLRPKLAPISCTSHQ